MLERKMIDISSALDGCIEKYISKKRSEVDSFSSNHFSLPETLRLQRKHLLIDLICSPINAAWAIPHVVISKTVETIDSLGWLRLTPALAKIPNGITTGYQKEIERLLLFEFLDFESLQQDMLGNKDLAAALKEKNIQITDFNFSLGIKKEVTKYSTSQAVISDLAGSLITLFAGWHYFGDRSLGVLGIGRNVARKFAQDKAASNFVLGKQFGSAFYKAFPPHPTGLQTLTATVGVGLLLTVVSFFITVMSDPIRKKLGFHKYKLNLMLDHLEESLFLQVKKTLKNASSESIKLKVS